MSASAEQIERLRRMVAEPTAETYSDAMLAAAIEARPVVDSAGRRPRDTSGVENRSWAPTYDLAAAAADLWEEKAAALAANYDFNADGGDYKRSQAFAQAQKMVHHYRSRVVVSSVPIVRDVPYERELSEALDGPLYGGLVVNRPPDDW